MSEWTLNIALPVTRVCEMLREMHGASVSDMPGGIGLSFGDQEIAWVGEAGHQDGTDIVIRDWSKTVGWRIYTYLLDRTTEYMWLMDDGQEIVASRWAPDQTSGRVPERGSPTSPRDAGPSA